MIRSGLRLGLVVVGGSVWLSVGCGGDEFGLETSVGSDGAASSGGRAPADGGGGAAAGSAGTSPGGTSASGGAGGQSPTGGAAGVPAGGGASAGAAGDAGGAGGASPTCGPGSALPTLYTTLDGAQAIQKPSFGTGQGTANGNFVTGLCQSGLAIVDLGHYLSYPALGNIALAQGTLELSFLPDHDAKDGKIHQLAFVPGKLSLAKSDTNQLVFGVGDAQGQDVQTIVGASAVQYAKGSWCRLKLTWDFAAAGQNVHVYFDGNEAKSYVQASSGPHTMGAVDGDDPLVVGSKGQQSPEVAGGVLDEVKLYAGVVGD